MLPHRVVKPDVVGVVPMMMMMMMMDPVHIYCMYLLATMLHFLVINSVYFSDK